MRNRTYLLLLTGLAALILQANSRPSQNALGVQVFSTPGRLRPGRNRSAGHAAG